MHWLYDGWQSYIYAFMGNMHYILANMGAFNAEFDNKKV